MSNSTAATTPSIEDVLRTPGRGRQEFAHGEFVEKPMGSLRHGELQALLGGLLAMFLKRSKAGRVVTEWHHRFGGEDDTRIFIPDLAVAFSQELPEYADRASDIMIEIVSPTQSAGAFADKVAFYLANGAREVWVVEPEEKWIGIYSPGQSPKHFGAGKTLVSSLLPGFEINVDEFFAE